MEILLNEYFRVWKWQLRMLNTSLAKIKLLPKGEAQHMQALIVRNMCLDFISEMDERCSLVLRDFVSWQDEAYLAAVDDIKQMDFSKRPWPFDLDIPARVAAEQKNLSGQVRVWAEQASRFEAGVLLTQEGLKGEAYSIIGTLTLEYGISPRIRKKK